MKNETKTPEAAEPSVPDRGITVEIAFATIPAFAQVQEVARRHPSFQQFGEGKALRLRVTYQFEELDALQELKNVSWELRHKRAWLHGTEVAWHEMAQLTHCFREWLGKPKPDHCFFDGNLWSGFGCRYAIANLSDRINNDWLTYGHLDSGGVWVFDKPRIADYVRKQVHRGFHHCPAWDEEYLELVLEILPERVDPVGDDRWQLLRRRDGQIVGVCPKDVDAAKKIVRELQAKVVERRGADKVQASGKRKLPAALFRAYQASPKQKKGWLARLVG